MGKSQAFPCVHTSTQFKMPHVPVKAAMPPRVAAARGAACRLVGIGQTIALKLLMGQLLIKLPPCGLAGPLLRNMGSATR